MSIVEKNYTSMLLEKCAKSGVRPPTFEDEILSQGSIPEFKCKCTLQEWTVEGVGFSKKIAKQSACKLMLDKTEVQDLFEKVGKTTAAEISVINMVYEYCTVHNKDLPLFSDKGKEGDLFVIECTVDGFTTVGKGRSKKVAKENAVNGIAGHFKVYEFYEDKKKLKERQATIKNPVARLYELCQNKKWECEFVEDKVIVDSEEAFVVTCIVNDVICKSSTIFSKKNAKTDAATKMLELLKNTTHFNTPGASPSQSHTQETSNSSVENTPVKSKRCIKEKVDTEHTSSKQRKLLLGEVASSNDVTGASVKATSPQLFELKPFLSSDEEDS